jgi:hypothetical protein
MVNRVSPPGRRCRTRRLLATRRSIVAKALPVTASAEPTVRAAGEHREAAEAVPLVVVEQLVAPVDGGAEGPVPSRRIARHRGGLTQCCVKPARDLDDGQQGASRGSKLDRQRQPVKPSADLRDGGCIRVCVSKLRVVDPCALGEERDRIDGGQRGQVGAASRVGEREREYGLTLLGLQGERLTASREHQHAGTAGNDISDERRRHQYVFAVVQNEQ